MKNLFNDLSNRIYCGFAIILSLCLLIACDSDDAPSQESLLPPITMTGENTFGCLVGGKYFRPRDGRSTINSDNKGLRIVQTENENLEFHVYDRKSDRTGSLFIHLENLFVLNEGYYNVKTATGLRGLDGPNHNYIYGRFWKNSEVGYQNYVSFENSGNVEVTNREFIPNESNIYSGTFHVKLINFDDVTDTIQISRGRFDLEAFSSQQHNWD
ncbi:hypothetical protein [Nonlabens sp.]|uniref:hypothetical protein n=1 Tax=Nonlabens sp. TaxID=1888209 RepID=UPI003F699D8A